MLINWLHTCCVPRDMGTGVHVYSTDNPALSVSLPCAPSSLPSPPYHLLSPFSNASFPRYLISLSFPPAPFPFFFHSSSFFSRSLCLPLLLLTYPNFLPLPVFLLHRFTYSAVLTLFLLLISPSPLLPTSLPLLL